MVIEILIAMLMASEPPINPQDINIISLSKVYHHIDKDICLGVEQTIKKQEWIEMPASRDIEVHKYEVVDIQPNKIIELYCVVHEKYEHLIYKETTNEDTMAQ